MRVLHAGLEWSYWGLLTPDVLERADKQVAGGETAMLRAAFETAARGHDVAIVSLVTPGRYRGVRFYPNEVFFHVLAEEGPWDAVVVWGNPDPFLTATPAGALGGALRVCAQQCNGFERPDAGQRFVDVYVSPSRTHADLLADRYKIPRDRWDVVPNGVEPSRFRFDRPRDPFAVYHASSPDRGLHHLLELWPEVRRREPRATLHVYYELDRLFSSVPANWPHPTMLDLARRMRVARDRLRHGHGVTFHGAQRQQVVIDRACAAGVLCYPCDPVIFTEGYGTTVLEGYIAGAVPVVSDADAFPEVYGDLFDLIPRPKIREQLVDRLVEAIDRARIDRESKRLGYAFADRLEWERITAPVAWASVGKTWCELLERRLVEKRGRRAAA